MAADAHSLRWRFPAPSNLAEAEQRARVISKMDAWWEHFGNASTDVAAGRGGATVDLPALMAHLEAINTELAWELGPGVQGASHRLVITPEEERHLRPMVDVLVSRAPRLPSWEFYSHRVPEDFDRAVMLAKARADVDVSMFDVEARRDERNFIHLRWTVPSGQSSRPSCEAGAFVATETLLGEEMRDTWIGAIEVAERPRPSLLTRWLGGAQSAKNPATLKARVEALVGEMDEERARKTRATEEAFKAGKQTGVGHVFKRQPPKAEDYPRREDLFVGVTARDPAWWLTAHSSLGFSSRRYSNDLELFCYVKMPALELAERGKLQDALDEALAPERVGEGIGGGTGLRYSYIDLALREPDRGLALVCDVLRKSQVPTRSWVLFFDDHLRYEWVGIYEDTPPTPDVPK